MKNLILSLILFSLALCASAQATYEVAIKENKPVLIEKSQAGLREIPVTSAQLSQDVAAGESEIRQLTEKRNRLAMLIQLDEQIAQAQNNQSLLSQLFEKVKAAEQQIAEPKPVAAEKKETPPPTKGGG